jgi:1,4-dihydroxy-2-naphthoate octaprenyltransferase
VAAPFVVAAGLAVMLGAPVLLVLVALPLAIGEVRALARRSGAELNASLAGTARLHLVFGVLFALGLVA